MGRRARERAATRSLRFHSHHSGSRGTSFSWNGLGGESGLMRERLPHGFRTDRQVTNASARGGKDRIRYCGRDWRRRRFAEADRRFGARKKFDHEFGYVAHAQRRIGVQIGVLRLTVYELRT